MASLLLFVLSFFSPICTICELYLSAETAWFQICTFSNSLIWYLWLLSWSIQWPNTYLALFSIPRTVNISTAKRDLRDTEVRGKSGAWSACVCVFLLGEGCEGVRSGVITTKFNASHDCINYSKIGRQIIHSSEVRSCLMLKVTVKRSPRREVINCNKTSNS